MLGGLCPRGGQVFPKGSDRVELEIPGGVTRPAGLGMLTQLAGYGHPALPRDSPSDPGGLPATAFRAKGETVGHARNGTRIAASCSGFGFTRMAGVPVAP